MAGRLRNSPWVRTQSHMALSQSGVRHRLASKVGLEVEKKIEPGISLQELGTFPNSPLFHQTSWDHQV